MIVEELIIQDVGLAMMAVGESPRDLDRMRYWLTHRSALRRLIADSRVHPATRMNIETTINGAESTADGAIQWMRSLTLLTIYQTQPQWHHRIEQLWSFIEYIAHGPEPSYLSDG